MYIKFWALKTKCTQYGLQRQATFKNVRTILFFQSWAGEHALHPDTEEGVPGPGIEFGREAEIIEEKSDELALLEPGVQDYHEAI